VHPLARREQITFPTGRVTLKSRFSPEGVFVEIEIEFAFARYFPDNIIVFLIQDYSAFHELAIRADDEVIGAGGITDVLPRFTCLIQGPYVETSIQRGSL
jgi:hypothetical protein